MKNLCELDLVWNGPPKSQKAPGAESGEEMEVGELALLVLRDRRQQGVV